MAASGGLLSCITFTRDPTGSFLLAASGSVIKLFSTATGAQVRLLEGHKSTVTAVAHSRQRWQRQRPLP